MDDSTGRDDAPHAVTVSYAESIRMFTEALRTVTFMRHSPDIHDDEKALFEAVQKAMADRIVLELGPVELRRVTSESTTIN